MGLLDDTIARLRDVLATVEDIDLWPPWDAAQTIVDAVAQAIEIATEPPPRSPATSPPRLPCGAASPPRSTAVATSS